MRDLSIISATAFLLVFSVDSISSLTMVKTRLDMIKETRQDWKVRIENIHPVQTNPFKQNNPLFGSNIDGKDKNI